MMNRPAKGYFRGSKKPMKRTLLLDEDDLIMVVKEDIVKQIDENRGELNRTEFVNYLIQCQLKKAEEEKIDDKEHISRDEFQAFSRQMVGLLHNFLQFFVSYGMSMGQAQADTEIQSLNRQLELFDNNEEESGEL